MSLDLAQLQGRLEAIERDLAEKQGPFEAAAEAKHRTDREFELRLARVKLQTSAPTETAKKDKALDAIAASDDENDLYGRYADANARYESLRVAVKVLETRATIGMSLLKSQRETGG